MLTLTGDLATRAAGQEGVAGNRLAHDLYVSSLMAPPKPAWLAYVGSTMRTVGRKRFGRGWLAAGGANGARAHSEDQLGFW